MSHPRPAMIPTVAAPRVSRHKKKTSAANAAIPFSHCGDGRVHANTAAAASNPGTHDAKTAAEILTSSTRHATWIVASTSSAGMAAAGLSPKMRRIAASRRG